jgi:AraC family transcriptional regulator
VILAAELEESLQILRISRKPQSATSATYVQRVNLAIDHIVGNLSDPPRLQGLSRVAMLSPFHFHRVFQALVGETPADFVRRLRLEKAIALMAGTRAGSLTAIALQCGFSSSSDFTRCFKRRFGVSPSSFDIKAWRQARGEELQATVEQASKPAHIKGLPPRRNPDSFQVKIRDIPARSVAYIRVDKPYQGNRVLKAIDNLLVWAERLGLKDRQWLGYQWDNPEITSLDDCRYYVAVEAEKFTAKGEVGRYLFPALTVAQVEIRGGIDLELRALQWLYGSWLPRSGFVPADHPCFEAWIGRPMAHGTEYFELYIQLPVRRT